MTDQRLVYLREKSSKLPRTPGVYIMKNKNDKVIYVGKSRSLKDRVSQYFHLSSDANVKTIRMVSQIYDFETIFCDTEIEAHIDDILSLLGCYDRISGCTGFLWLPVCDDRLQAPDYHPEHLLCVGYRICSSWCAADDHLRRPESVEEHQDAC